MAFVDRQNSVVAFQTNMAFTGAMNELTDEQLMLQYARGDAEAFGHLYSKHRGGTFRFCNRQLNDKRIAEECFQEIWMKVVKSRINYQPTALFTTYLYRIAQNCVIDAYRKEKRRQFDVDIDDEEITFKSNLLDAKAIDGRPEESREQIEYLKQCIYELPQEQKNTLLLKLNSGLSLEQIAAITDCKKETVKSRLRYATSRLKIQLKARLNHDELANEPAKDSGESK